MKISAEIVNGKCPTCDEFTMLVGLTKEMYRCMNCGADLEQHINGKITAERQYSETVSYKCYKGKAKTEIYMGEKSIKALILE